MKNALKLFVIYLLLMVLGIGIGSVLYSIYLNIISSVNGDNCLIIDINTYLRALFYVIPCACIVICPIIAFVHIRLKGDVFQVIMYILLSLLTWLFILPYSFHLGSKYVDKNFYIENGLSKNCFREGEDNKIYYFTSDLNNYTESTAIVIDKSHSRGVSIESVKDYTMETLYEDAAPYKDVLIKNCFKEKHTLKFLDFGYLVQNANKALDGGIKYWVDFWALGFVLCSLYGLCTFFLWKLLDVWLVVFTAVLIIFVNTYSFINPALYSIVQKINSVKMFKFLGKYINEPFFVLLNVIFGLIFVITGIIKFVQNKKKQQIR